MSGKFGSTRKSYSSQGIFQGERNETSGAPFRGVGLGHYNKRLILRDECSVETETFWVPKNRRRAVIAVRLDWSDSQCKSVSPPDMVN